MTVHCEMWCEPDTTIVTPGDGGFLGSQEMSASCAHCEKLTHWLCHDVLPSIRRHGYYVPAGTPVDAELAAMISQQPLRGELRDLLKQAFPNGIPGGPSVAEFFGDSGDADS